MHKIYITDTCHIMSYQYLETTLISNEGKGKANYGTSEKVKQIMGHLY